MFAPSDITGLAIWLQASDLLNGGALPGNGAAVSSWKDKSGNGRDATQATPANQPSFSASGFQGKQAVNFAPPDRWLSTAAINLSQPGTVFLAGNWGAALTTPQYMMDGATNRWLINNNNPGSATSLCYYAGSAVIVGTVPSNALASPCITTTQFNGSSSFNRLNGTQVGSGNGGSASLDTLSIGDRSGLTGGGFQGVMAELIVYNAALSAQDIQRVETYLAYTYNLTLQEVSIPTFPAMGGGLF